jgi:hypothetical protein
MKLWPLDVEKKLRIFSFPHFFFCSAYRYLFDIWYIALQCQDPLIFHEVMALELRKKSRIISFLDFFFSLLTDIHLIFGTLFCHTKIQIKFEFGSDPLIFHKVMDLGLRKISRIISFPDFLSLLTDIHSIFGTLFCHTKLQIKFKFGFLSI